MRPLELKLAHFGPYRGQAVLDFEALDRLFLVCGPTGAGKTTLFDALTYALYEKTSGTRGGLTDQLASHHAPEGAVPEVSLRFSLGVQQWRVTRHLRHRVPKKKGEGWTVQEPQVLLEKKQEDGWEAIPGKRSEINQKLEDLIGLSAEEFAKIVVLPQGDFQRFLEASTGDREKMLQKLFPVEAYDRLVDALKTKARVVEDARKRWEDRWQELVARLGPGSDRPALEEAWAETVSQAQSTAAEEEAASVALVRLRALHSDWIVLETKREEKARLEARRPRIEAARHQGERAKKARPLGPDLDRQALIKTEGLKLREDQDRAREALNQVEVGLADLASRADQTEAREARLTEVLKQRGLIDHQVTLWNDAETLRTNELAARKEEDRTTRLANEARTQVALAQKTLTPAPEGPALDEALALLEAARSAERAARDHAAVEQQRATLQAEMDGATAAEVTARKTVDAALREEALWTQVIEALKAATLAQTLTDGQPCPVCGSVDHPVPAPWPQASNEAPERLDAARRTLIAARASFTEAQVRRLTASDQQAQLPPSTDQPPNLEMARKTLESAENHLATLQAWTRTQALARQAVEAATAREAAVDRERQVAVQAREAWTIRLQALAESVPQDPRPQREALVTEERELRRQLDEERRRAEVLGRDREGLKAKIDGLEVRLTAQRDEYRRIQVVLEAAVATLGWTLDELSNYRLPEGELASLENEVSSFDRETHRLDGETSALEALFSQGPPAPLEPAIQTLDDAKLRRQAADSLAKEKEFALRDRDRIEDELREADRQKQALEADFQSLVPLARALDGHNGLNLRLTTWVLVQALEQVTQSATHRLSAMSGGRYALKVQTRGSDARKDWGLDLAVVDGHTGQERAVGTLSGGEKFMTSISLALGLADVIQERSGGLKLEAIFIDEGFGTLDDQSLDRAMAILHDLGQHRSVGIISHVAELRQRISSRVEVVKGKNGSTLVQ